MNMEELIKVVNKTGLVNLPTQLQQETLGFWKRVLPILNTVPLDETDTNWWTLYLMGKEN